MSSIAEIVQLLEEKSRDGLPTDITIDNQNFSDLKSRTTTNDRVVLLACLPAILQDLLHLITADQHRQSQLYKLALIIGLLIDSETSFDTKTLQFNSIQLTRQDKFDLLTLDQSDAQNPAWRAIAQLLA